jgi:hypothetical protein
VPNRLAVQIWPAFDKIAAAWRDISGGDLYVPTVQIEGSRVDFDQSRLTGQKCPVTENSVKHEKYSF